MVSPVLSVSLHSKSQVLLHSTHHQCLDHTSDHSPIVTSRYVTPSLSLGLSLSTSHNVICLFVRVLLNSTSQPINQPITETGRDRVDHHMSSLSSPLIITPLPWEQDWVSTIHHWPIWPHSCKRFYRRLRDWAHSQFTVTYSILSHHQESVSAAR